MMSKMDEVLRKVLNDRDIFDTPYDKKTKVPIPKLFDTSDWKELEKLFHGGKKKEFTDKVDQRIREIENREQKNQGGGSRWRRLRIDELKQRSEWLKSAFDNKPNLLKQLFEYLDWYGLVKCKLPTMDQYGKVIERYDISIVEEYFIDKMKRSSSKDYETKALKKALEYVKVLFNSGVSREEIAYFVRKLNSLTKYWEVIE